MSTDRPFALHLTWTTYGTWLPGDERGYVSHTLESTGDWLPRENIPGTPYAKAHERTHRLAQTAQKGETVWLTSELARVAAEALIAAASERGWKIARGSIMAGHLHLVVSDCPNDGPAVRRILKGNSQVALSRHNGKPQRWWTAGGSDRYKNDDQAIANAIEYVRNQEKILVAIENNEIVG